MRIIRNTALFLTALVLLAGLVACSGGKGHSDSAADSRILVTTQCDTGATINPTSIRVNNGDRPTFDITLASGYAIQTIYCTSGGSLVGTQFRMGSVQGADNVHVVTQNRWVGSSVQGLEASVSKSIVTTASGTTAVHATQFATSDVVATVEAEPNAKLILRAELFGKQVSVPLTESNPGQYEARFVLGEVAPQKEGDSLPDMLYFNIVRENEAEHSTHGALLIAVRK
jgi:hypothetical protein